MRSYPTVSNADAASGSTCLTSVLMNTPSNARRGRMNCLTNTKATTLLAKAPTLYATSIRINPPPDSATSAMPASATQPCVMLDSAVYSMRMLAWNVAAYVPATIVSGNESDATRIAMTVSPRSLPPRISAAIAAMPVETSAIPLRSVNTLPMISSGSRSPAVR